MRVWGDGSAQTRFWLLERRQLVINIPRKMTSHVYQCRKYWTLGWVKTLTCCFRVKHLYVTSSNCMLLFLLLSWGWAGVFPPLKIGPKHLKALLLQSHQHLDPPVLPLGQGGWPGIWGQIEPSPPRYTSSRGTGHPFWQNLVVRNDTSSHLCPDLFPTVMYSPDSLYCCFQKCSKAPNSNVPRCHRDF